MRESSYMYIATSQYLPSHSTQSPPLHPIHTHNHTPTPSQYLTSPPTTSLPYPPHMYPLSHSHTSVPPPPSQPHPYFTHPQNDAPLPHPPSYPSLLTSQPTLPPQFHPITPHCCTHHPSHNTLIPHPPSQPHPYASPPSHMHHTSAPPTLTITTTPLHHPHTPAPHTFILTVCFQASSETSWSWWSRVFPSAACVRGRGRGERWRERTWYHCPPRT